MQPLRWVAKVLRSLESFFQLRLDVGLMSSSCGSGRAYGPSRLNEDPMRFLSHRSNMNFGWFALRSHDGTLLTCVQILGSTGILFAFDATNQLAISFSCCCLRLALVLEPFGIAAALERKRSSEDLCFPELQIDTSLCAGNVFMIGTLILEACAGGVSVSDAGSGAACGYMILGADASVAAGGLGAFVTREVGLLIEFNDKGLDPLSISMVAPCASTSSSEWKSIVALTVVAIRFVVLKSKNKMRERKRR